MSTDVDGLKVLRRLRAGAVRKKIDAGRSPMIHTMRGAGDVLKPATD